MKLLPIYNGNNIIDYLKVDDDIYDQIHWRKITLDRHGYPRYRTSIKILGKKRGLSVYIHRSVMNFPNNMQVDHINRNVLDAQRENLRIVNNKQNNENRNIQSNNSSGIRGVGWHTKSQKWRAYVEHNGKHIHLGTFDNINDADNAASKKRKELNFLTNRRNNDE